jgi:hypothetical protein
MKENDYKSNFKTAAEVLKSLLDSKKGGAVSENFMRWKLWLNWSDVVGKTMSENCEPIAYHEGTLWLWVKNSVWMQQISFMLEPIKNTINEKYKKGYVKEVRLTLDRRTVPSRSDENFAHSVKKMIDR